jgi:hypothetical protein
VILTYRYRIKDNSAKKSLRRHAFAVNQPTDMKPAFWNQRGDVLRDPLPNGLKGGSVDPIGVVERGEDRQIVVIDSRRSASLGEDFAQDGDGLATSHVLPVGGRAAQPPCFADGIILRPLGSRISLRIVLPPSTLNLALAGASAL